MTFANPLPWWALLLVVAAAALVAWHAYRYFAASAGRRAALTALRFVTLLLLVLFLMRPVTRSAGTDARDVLVPILVDASRSMGIEDAGRGSGSGRGARRIDRARAVLEDRLLPVLGPRFSVEVLSFGDALAEAVPDGLTATGRRSDLAGAIQAVREKYRGRPIAGIVLLSDGGATGGGSEQAAESGPAIYPMGIGSTGQIRDREILSVTAAEAVLDESRLELSVTAVSHGAGSDPIELRLLENGRPIEVRRASPGGDGIPVHEVFQVAPASGAPTVYTVETSPLPGELVPENNTRSTLVQPPARPRRVLLIEGAPGYEHSFLKRAWLGDTGLQVDSVVRKGKNEQGNDTFYIQAVKSRSQALSRGYPTRVEDLFQYDAIVLANVEGSMLTRAQLDATREFVGRRGGGLLVLGARSFLRQGLLDTPIEEVLPLSLTGRGGGVLPAGEGRGLHRAVLTPDGERHPVMQLAAALEDTRKRWEEVPALAAVSPLGGPRPGATVLAVTSGAGGAPRALVAVQRYGEGRAMVFTGEAAWRWRMMMPSADRSYDIFWRQAIRWLALPAGDPLDLTLPAGAAPGETLALRVNVRDAAFEPRTGGTVTLRVTRPDGRLDEISAAPDTEAGEGWYVASYRPEQAGVHRVTASATEGETSLGSTAASMLVGGVDAEMATPWLDSALLERVAAASGGHVIDEDDVQALARTLEDAVPAAMLAVRRDLWHTGWSFAVILGLLGAEWVLRRRWGLR